MDGEPFIFLVLPKCLTSISVFPEQQAGKEKYSSKDPSKFELQSTKKNLTSLGRLRLSETCPSHEFPLLFWKSEAAKAGRIKGPESRWRKWDFYYTVGL